MISMVNSIDISNVEFSWPWIFILLPLPVLVLLSLPMLKPVDKQSIKVVPGVATAFEQLNNHKSSTLARGYRLLQILFLFIAWVALLTAIAQPTIAEQNTANTASGRAIALLIDLSTSMERRDFSINNEPVDRLTVVKDIAGQFIVKRTGDRLGLVLFGSEAFIASPLSYDLDSVNHVLQSSGIGMAGRTTAMGDALGLSIQSLRDDPAIEKAIVLLSDGTNNAGTAEPEDAARLAAELGIVVYTIGLGSDEITNQDQQFQSAAADLDEATLKAIAAQSGGQFFRANTVERLSEIYQQIDSLESASTDAPATIIRRDYRNIFILVSLLCVCLFLATSTQRMRLA